MVNVSFAGITGWTAPAIVAAIDDADDLTLTSGVSRSAAGQSLATATGSASHGSVCATVAEALESAAVDVLVDYTSAAAVKSNVWTAVEAGVHVVIGSSGLTSDDYEELDRLARDRGVGVIAAGNFSVMAAVLVRAASMAAEHVDRWEIIDYASDDKPDVPSGTSRELAETLAQVREPVVTVALSELHGPVEARGAEVAGVRIHSVRLPSFVVSTEVVFGGPGERLVMRHDPGMTPAPYVVQGPCWPYARWPTWQVCAGDWTRCCSRSLRQTAARKKRELACHSSHQARPGTGQPWPRACRIPGSAPIAMGRRRAPVGRADRQIRPAAFEWA